MFRIAGIFSVLSYRLIAAHTHDIADPPVIGQKEVTVHIFSEYKINQSLYHLKLKHGELFNKKNVLKINILYMYGFGIQQRWLLIFQTLRESIFEQPPVLLWTAWEGAQ